MYVYINIYNNDCETYSNYGHTYRNILQKNTRLFFIFSKRSEYRWTTVLQQWGKKNVSLFRANYIYRLVGSSNIHVKTVKGKKGRNKRRKWKTKIRNHRRRPQVVRGWRVNVLVCGDDVFSHKIVQYEFIRKTSRQLEKRI